MRKIFVLAAFVFSLHSVCALPPPVVAAKSCFFVDADTGNELFKQGENNKEKTASLAKIMTVLVALEEVEKRSIKPSASAVQKKNPNLPAQPQAAKKVAAEAAAGVGASVVPAGQVASDNKGLGATTVAPRAVFDRLYGTHAAAVGISAGEEVTLRDLVAATMIASGCDGAEILSHAFGGLVGAMNDKATLLGCSKNTHFVDASGISEENVSTARDMVLILREALTKPVLVDLAAKKTYQMSQTNKRKETTIYTTNQMLLCGPYHDSRVTGFKTGSFPDLQNFASFSCHKGMNVAGVVMGFCPPQETKEGEFPPKAFTVTKQILDYIYSNYERRTLAAAGALLNEIRVRGSGEVDHVGLVTKIDILATLPKDTKSGMVTKQFALPAFLVAPIVAGTKIGTVSFYLGQNKLAEADLFTSKVIKSDFVGQVSLLLRDKRFVGALSVVAAALLLVVIRKRNLRRRRRR
ncbi:MAG: hypothetical protein LBJ38_02115 [Oscillospiraceae bacterium]|nr:hypothetical protein [Oscillospiraceae bacterium]